MVDQGLAPGWTRPRLFADPPPALPREQLLLFPRHTIMELEPDPRHSDLFKFAQGDDGLWYFLKTDLGSSPTRANEWIAHRLARMIGIPVPAFCTIRARNGDVLFGSLKLDDVSDSLETAIFLREPSFNELGVLAGGLRELLSSIYTFDMFLQNIDRHLENYISVVRGTQRELFAIDFARSIFYDWPLEGFMALDCNTRDTWRHLRAWHGFDEQAAQVTLNRLAAIRPSEIESVLREMPAHWLSAERQEAFIAYCVEGGWLSRVDQLRQGLSNGSLA